MENHMSEQLRESLSAVMDGEADEFEIRRVLGETVADPELRGAWERYHLVRSVLRGEGHGPSRSETLKARMWAKIDTEGENNTDDPVDVGLAPDFGDATVNSRPSSWSQRIAGVAVAAGVAAAVIIGFRPTDTTQFAAPQVAVVAPAPVSTPAALFVEGPPMEATQAVPAALDVQRAHAYMLHHAHHVALNNRSVVPFVKVAAFESK